MNKCTGCDFENVDTLNEVILRCSDCKRAYDNSYKAIYYQDLYSKKKEGEEKNG